MPKQLQPRAYNVEVTEHAWERFLKRGGPYAGISRKKLNRIMHAKINDSLGPGIRFDQYPAAGKLEVFPYLCAVIQIGSTGWKVLTFRNLHDNADQRKPVRRLLQRQYS